MSFIATFLLSTAVFAASFDVNDSFAGLPLTVSISDISQFSDYFLVLETPNSELSTFSFQANSTNYDFILEKDYFNKSGNYKFLLKDSSYNLITTKDFFVYPNKVSNENSFLSPENYVADLKFTTVEVFLRDNFDNPIKGHNVKLIPSVSDILVNSDSLFTDENGRVSFDIDLLDNDVVAFTAYDLTDDLLLDSRSNIVQIASVSDNFASKSLFASSVGNSSGPVSALEFTEIPEQIYVNESATMAVKAVDSTDSTVNSYTGTVRFSVLSDNFDKVTIPSDYTFLATDQGEHIFSLVFFFQEEGEYEIEVRDLANSSVFANYTFNVTKPSLSPSTSSSALSINNPLPGTYSNNIQLISGIADPGQSLKIFDNDVHLTSVTADVTGAFSYTTPPLVDGEHNIYLVVLDTNGIIVDTSEVLTFFIDTSAPEIDRAEVLPVGDIYAGDLVTVNLYMKEELSQAAFLFNENIYDFQFVSDGNYYSLEFRVPTVAGIYNADLVLLDLLNNESKFSSYFSFDILERTFAPISKVQNLKYETDSFKVNLAWDKVLDSDYPISFYKIYYGLNPDSLINVIDTFTDYNSWYIPNLENSREYYFAVKAVDLYGNESVDFSEVIAATPNPKVLDVEDPNITHGVAGSEILGEIDEDVSKTGPDILFLIPLSVFLSFAFYK